MVSTATKVVHWPSHVHCSFSFSRPRFQGPHETGLQPDSAARPAPFQWWNPALGSLTEGSTPPLNRCGKLLIQNYNHFLKTRYFHVTVCWPKEEFTCQTCLSAADCGFSDWITHVKPVHSHTFCKCDCKSLPHPKVFSVIAFYLDAFYHCYLGKYFKNKIF